MTTIVEAQTEAEIRNCFPVLVQLREHLQAETFVEQVRRLQSVSGYRLFFVQHQEEVVAVAGVRVVENFAWRRHLYVDDWVTDQAHRSSGHGEELFRFLIGLAQEEGCLGFGSATI